MNWSKASRRVADLYLWRGVPKNVIERYLHNPFSLIANTYDPVFKLFPPDKATEILEEASRILEVEEFEALSKATAVPSCEEVLQWLKERKIHVGVVSTISHRIVLRLLQKLELAGFIEKVVARDVLVKMKPYPDQIKLCLERMGCSQEDAVVVGVDEDDVRAAKALQMHIIIVLPESHSVIAELLDVKTDSMVENLNALLAFFNQL